MLILGNMLWRTTGVGAPPPPPAPPAQTTEPTRGTAEWLAGYADPRRSEADIRKARERFGIRDEVAAALAEVAERQAQAEAASKEALDEQKRFDELYRELDLRRIEYDARYAEILSVMREQALAHIRQQRQQEDELMLLMLIAVAAVS